MTEEAKQARLAYRREWQRKNRDKVKAYNERYWEKKAAAQKTADQEAPAADQETPAADQETPGED